ncbi:MAG: RNA polymerase sigma factor [Solirubrobacterales bacterium]
MEAAVAEGRSAPTLPVGRPPRLLKLASDERLVALVRHGDERAFEALYDRHHRGILAFCRHMLGSREEAEDAVQHTFLSAYRALRDSEQDVALRPWLYAIARNRCLSMLRARREDDPLADAAEPSVVGLAAEVERREDLRQLLRDLHRLPDDQRAALVLAEVADLGHDEIAQVIGVPRPKVKALVFQARESLIASRRAREIPCSEIRAELATLRGGALRRSHLRRHLSECPACRGYREEVRRQRASLAVLLPVVPGVGLKRATIASALGTGGGAAGGAAGTAGGIAVLKGTAAKVAIGAVIAGGAVTGGVVGVRQLTQSSPLPPTAGATGGAASAHPHGLNAAPAVAAAASAGPSTTTRSAGASGTAHRRKHRRRHHHKHHSTPASVVPATTPAATVAPPVAVGRVNQKPKDKVKGRGKAKGHTKHPRGTTSPPKAHPQRPQQPVTPTRTQPSSQPKQHEPSTSTPSSSASESGGTPAPTGGSKGKRRTDAGHAPG